MGGWRERAKRIRMLMRIARTFQPKPDAGNFFRFMVNRALRGLEKRLRTLNFPWRLVEKYVFQRFQLTAR
jgi:hypothetical protein